MTASSRTICLGGGLRREADPSRELDEEFISVLRLERERVEVVQSIARLLATLGLTMFGLGDVRAGDLLPKVQRGRQDTQV